MASPIVTDPPVWIFAIWSVVAPDPPAIICVFDAELDPRVIVPCIAVPPTTIVPVVIAAPTFTILVAPELARLSVVVPAPSPIAIRLVCDELPITILPVAAVPPSAHVPVVIAAPIVMTVAVPVVRVKFPEPAFKVRAAAPVAEPIVRRLANAESPIWIVRAAPPVPILIVSVVASAPILIAVPPDAHVPPAVNVTVVAPRVVNTAAAGVVPPVAGGAANTAAKLLGCTARATRPVEAVPATAFASVARVTMP